MDVSGQLHAPAALPLLKEISHTLWVRNWMGSSARLYIMMNRNILPRARVQSWSATPLADVLKIRIIVLLLLVGRYWVPRYLFKSLYRYLLVPGTAATLAYYTNPDDRWGWFLEQLVEWKLAGETEVLGENYSKYVSTVHNIKWGHIENPTLFPPSPPPCHSLYISFLYKTARLHK
jgi:hypothetical protein